MKVTQKRKALLCAATLVVATFFPLTIPHAQGTAGQLDATFGTGGVVTTDLLSGNNQAYAMAVQPDGKVCVAGRTNDFASLFGVVRYLPDGQLDSTFGTSGELVTGVTESYNSPTAMILQPDGKLIVGGFFLALADEVSFGLVRLNPDGQLDQSFGVNGKVVENGVDKEGKSFRMFAGIDAASAVQAMAMQPDGKIVVVGGYAPFPSSDTKLFVLRLNADGSLDQGFGQQGIVLRNLAFDNGIADVMVQADGKLAIAGSGKSPNDQCMLLRLNADGSPDAAFGSGGTATTQFGRSSAGSAALAVTSEGKYLLAGSVSDAASPDADDFALARFNNDGSIDASFGTNGVVTKNVATNDRVRDLLIQPDGKILLAGYSGVQTAIFVEPLSARFALLRFNADGSEDADFNAEEVTNDASRLTLAYAVALQPDGRIVMTGTIGSGTSNFDFLTARFESGIVIPKPFNVTGATLRQRAKGKVLNPISVKPNGKKFDLIIAEDATAPVTASLGAQIQIDGVPFETTYTTNAAGVPVFVTKLKRDSLAQPGTLHIKVVRIDSTQSNELTLQILPATP